MLVIVLLDWGDEEVTGGVGDALHLGGRLVEQGCLFRLRESVLFLILSLFKPVLRQLLMQLVSLDVLPFRQLRPPLLKNFVA